MEAIPWFGSESLSLARSAALNADPEPTSEEAEDSLLELSTIRRGYPSRCIVGGQVVGLLRQRSEIRRQIQEEEAEVKAREMAELKQRPQIPSKASKGAVTETEPNPSSEAGQGYFEVKARELAKQFKRKLGSDVLPYLEQLFERDIAHCCAELKLDRLAVTPGSRWMARIQHPHFGLECFFVCQNASQKMGIRLLPSVRAALASNEAPSEFMIFALAVILRFLTPIGGFPKSMEGTVTCIMPFLDGKELAKVEAVCLKWRTLPDQLNTWDTLRQAYIARALDCLENLLGWEVENVIWPEEKGEGGPAKPYVGLLQSFVLELEEEDYSTCCECKVHYTRCCKDALSCQYCDKDWCPECARYAPSKDEVGCPDCPDWSKVSCRECFDQGKSIFCRCYGTDSWHYACGRHGFECKRCGEQLCFICEERHSYDCRDDGEEEEDETG
ncbi:unnamed protein product [Symbiodinium microadriaticum]|nr:unnamed protein product [Symbiodinium microadriaticum]